MVLQPNARHAEGSFSNDEPLLLHGRADFGRYRLQEVFGRAVSYQDLPRLFQTLLSKVLVKLVQFHYRFDFSVLHLDF